MAFLFDFGAEVTVKGKPGRGKVVARTEHDDPERGPRENEYLVAYATEDNPGSVVRTWWPEGQLEPAPTQA